MWKIAKFFGMCALLLACVWLGTVIADRQSLGDDLIRLHVVADSNSEEDQQVKFKVRDAVMERLASVMEQVPSAQEAKDYIAQNLEELEKLANQVLEEAGSACKATVTFVQEAFATREYDTFTLPAGVYDSLRITIGEGEGENWWCVVFPSLCVPATTEGFADTAAGAGFDNSLTGALTGEPVYQVRFFLLDCLGWIENFFHQG